MFVETNFNPRHRRVGDCVVRAISAALNQDWDTTYVGVALKGFEMADMPSSNAVWSAYLKDKGFSRHVVPHDMEDIYTVADFAKDHPKGTYVLGIDGHVVCVKDGSILDSWDSSEEIPVYFWGKANNKQITSK